MQIKWIVDHFEQYNQISDFQKTRRQRVCTPELVEEVRERLSTTPTVSSRQLAQSIGVSHSLTYITMRSIAYLYKFSVCHKLKPGDGARRTKFCRRILDFASNENVFNKFYFSSEAWFHLSGYINSQNCRTCSATNPHQFMELTLYPPKISVFCAMSREKIVEPFFFTTTINGDQYEDLMRDFIS